jgi:hypothetical protein
MSAFKSLAMGTLTVSRMIVEHGEPLDVKMGAEREREREIKKTTKGKGTLRTTVRRSSG